MNDNQKIIDLEYRLNYFPGLTSLIKIVQKSNPQISKQEIVYFFEKDITTQLTKKQPKIKPIGHITALSLNEGWQMDIFDLSRYHLFNKHYRYLLACVDVFSRKAYVQPMLNKDDESVKKALITIFKDTKPESILSDHDSSFLSKTVQAYLSSLKIPLNVNALSDHHPQGDCPSSPLYLTRSFQSFVLWQGVSALPLFDDLKLLSHTHSQLQPCFHYGTCSTSLD